MLPNYTTAVKRAALQHDYSCELMYTTHGSCIAAGQSIEKHFQNTHCLLYSMAVAADVKNSS